MRPPRGNHYNDLGGRGSPQGSKRGSPHRGRGTLLSRGRGKPRYRNLDELDFELQIYDDAPNLSRGSSLMRGRGRGRGSPSSTSGSGDRRFSAPRARGRGRRPNFFLNDKAPLAKLLDLDRPFLKPIKFVPAQFTPILFQEDEDILQTSEATIVDQNNVPTAEKVNHIFSGQSQEEIPEFLDNSFVDRENEEEIVTVEFNSLAEYLANTLSVEELNQNVAETVLQPGKISSHETEVSTGDMKEVVHTRGADSVNTNSFAVGAIPEQLSDNFVKVFETNELREEYLRSTLQEDEEIIVYSPPQYHSGRDHLRAESSIAKELESNTASNIANVETEGKDEACNIEFIQPSSAISLSPTRIPTPPSFESFSLSFNSISNSRNSQMRKATSSRSHRLTKKGRLLARLKMGRERSFASFGAMMEETHLHDQFEEHDPQRSNRRRGDSDLDWGDSNSDQPNESKDQSLSGPEEMDIDGDLDEADFIAFGKRMGVEENQKTMNDVVDINKLREEDEDEDEESSSESDQKGDEKDEIVAAEERKLVGDDFPDANSELGVSSDTEEDDDDDSSSGTSTKAFTEKLTQLREKAKGKAKARDSDSSDEDISDDEDNLSRVFTWAEEDDNFINQLNEFMDREIGFRERRRNSFNESDFELHTSAKRRKDKIVPPELKEQWEKDRAKKAENKRKRAQARLEAAADPFIAHKTGKKARKAMLRALEFDVDSPKRQRFPDMAALEVQLRTFINNIGGQNTMALPPMEKFARKKVHELAQAFNLKSKSMGRGNTRYTTLIRTSRSGIAIDEPKIRRIAGRMGGARITTSRSKPSTGAMPRHRDGDEVGKAAPKIDSSNIGFRLLAAMGWSDGDRIGTSDGLSAPLTAIIKNTKLGLGATH